MREPLPSDVLETSVAGATDPVAEALRRADLAALWAAIDALPAAQREALLLREFGGLSYGELAAALAVSEPAVESLLYRARRRLRVQLRAAAAALTGASWLEALGRLLAGGGAPAAAKVAALGVGAAAIGSGAVVPQVFDNHHPARPVRPPAAVRHVHRQAKRVPVVPAPRVIATTPVRREHRRGRPHESAPGPSQDDHSQPGGGGGDGGDDGAVATIRPQGADAGRDGGGPDDAGHDGGGRDGGGDGGH